MTTRATCICVTVLVALIFSICVLAAVDRPAEAQVQTPDQVLDDIEAYRFRKWVARLKSAVESEEPGIDTTRQANRRVFGQSLRSAVPRLGPHLVKGGLASVAAGIWIHNGLTIYYHYNGNPANAIHLDAEFKKHNSGGHFVYRDAGGNITAQGAVTKVDWNVASAGYGMATYHFTFKEGGNGEGYGGIGTCVEPCTMQINSQGNLVSPTTPAVNTVRLRSYSTSPLTSNSTGTLASNRGYQLYVTDGNSGSSYSHHWLGPERLPKIPGSYSYDVPVYESGNVVEVSAAPSNSLQLTPQESSDLYNEIRDETCTPTADPDTTPEVCPDTYPEEWEQDEEWRRILEREFPGGPDTWPNADPDDDQVPNKEDQDDDGDEIPDEQDPEPYVIPPQHPNADPDEDGEPNREDEDDDGDEIPDEEDPAPWTPTTPDQLPEDHPYADPDEDGEPNRNDQDDDGDGYPDTSDPHPYDPSSPTPDEDTDSDDVPNRIDPDPSNPASPQRWTDADEDGDGSPDTFDPEPQNPSQPDGGPDADSDGDGQPNRHDPYPQNPSRPATNDPDLDGDGTPNPNDPDPYRPGEPDGGPDGDPDGDGTPNGQDPAPNDPSKPPPSEGAFCLVTKPYKFDLPRFQLLNVFPFSLVLKAWNIMQSLVAPPQRPVFHVPLMGDLTVSDELDAQVQVVKTAIAMVLFIGMLFWFWRMITGKGSDGGGA